MSIRFAGSRCVDERRRRRLAQEADGAESVVRPGTRRGDDGNSRDEEEAKLPRGSSPADTLISPRLWKHAVIGVAGILAWLAVLMIGDRADRARSGMEAIVGLSAGKLTTFFSTVMLLAAGQLAFINLWYRSKSRKDFNGGYKLWFWTAVAWLMMCALRATGAHWSLADAALAGRPMAIWNGRMILWLIPAAITLVTLYALLRREMRDCRESLWTLRLASAAAFANGLTLLFGQFSFDPRTQLIAESGLAMAWHMLLAFSMLLHARHVIHVSNEPPRSAIRRLNWSLFIPRWPQRLRGSRNETASKSSAAAEEEQSAAGKASSRSQRSSSRPKKPLRRKSAPVEAAVDEDGAIDDESELTSAEESVDAGEESEQSAHAERRVDPPQASAARKPHFVVQAATSVIEESDDAERSDNESTDDGAGRTLSKQERRRLKKRQRQQARAGG